MWIAVGLTLLTAALWLIFYNPFARNLSQKDFPRILENLLTRTENGGFCRFDFQDSPYWFSIERLSGSGRTAVLALRVPRQDWTIEAVRSLKDAFSAQGFKWHNEDDNPSLLGKVHIPVDDIWSSSAAASGAHAARIYCQALQIPTAARLKVEEGGCRTKEWWEHRLN